MRAADGEEERQVVDAVGVGEGVGQVDVVAPGPGGDRRPLPGGPHELALQLAGEGATLLAVAGGHDVVEAQPLGQGAHEVVGRGGGEHDGPALGAVVPDEGEGVGGDVEGQRVGRLTTQGPQLLGVPSLGDQRRPPRQHHGRERLSHHVEEGVHGPLAREVALRHQPRAAQRPGDDPPAGPLQEGAVHVEEGGAASHGRRS